MVANSHHSAAEFINNNFKNQIQLNVRHIQETNSNHTIKVLLQQFDAWTRVCYNPMYMTLYVIVWSCKVAAAVYLLSQDQISFTENMVCYFKFIWYSEFSEFSQNACMLSVRQPRDSDGLQSEPDQQVRYLNCILFDRNRNGSVSRPN